MIIMVTGGRDYDDLASVRRALLPYRNVGNILITGGADGADYQAEIVWHEFQLPYVTVPAPWDRMDRAAGMARNHTMVVGNSIAPYAVLVPDVVVAFPGGWGTAGAVREAKKYNIEVVYADR